MLLFASSSVDIDPPPRRHFLRALAPVPAAHDVYGISRAAQLRGVGVIARSRLIDALAGAVEAIVVVSLIVNIVTTFANTLVRSLFGQDFAWASDLWAILISIITFLGAAACFRRTTGMAYTALIDQAQGARREMIEACGLAIFLGTCLVALAAFPKSFAGQHTQ